LLSVTLTLPGFTFQPAAAADLAAGFGPVTFDDNALPNGWTVLPANGPGWVFNDPGQRGNLTGVANGGGFAIADSDNAGRAAMDTQLRSPAVDLSGASSARLTFNTIFQAYEQSTADVDFSVDGGNTWTNLWRTTTGTRGKITLNLPAAALSQANVILRFRYYNAFYSWYWQLDNIQLTVQTAATPPAAPSGVQANVAGSQVTVNWTDNSNDETGFKVQRSEDGNTWTTVATVAPNSTSARDTSVGCGKTYSYQVLASSAAGDSAASNVVQAETGACAGAPSLNQSFDGTALPTGWTITPNSGNTAWLFNDPKTRGNQTGGAGGFAIADSDNAGSVAMNAVLQSPQLDFSNNQAVELTFKTFFKLYKQATADVDISSDGGQTWTNVWRKTADFKGEVKLDVSAQAGGKSNVLLRFRYYNANFDWYWQIDDVQMQGITAPAAPGNLTANRGNASQVNLSWNGNNAPRFEVQRSTDNGANWTRIADVTNGATTYVDNAVESNTDYSYRVRAANAAGQSGFSNTVSIKTGDRSIRTFDIIISLYRPTIDDTTRANYERILRYFADSVYEMSNGVHKLRNIKIYLGGANKDKADVIWVPTCHPAAHPNGYGKDDWNISMCDVFGSQTYLESDGWAQVGGFGSLGHEWGHYFFGLYDEYRDGNTCTATTRPTAPCSTDTPVPNSLMHNGDPAGNVPERPDLNGDLSWANFSTALNNTRNTAQHRAYGASGWETIVRPPSQDPRAGRLSSLSSRLYWPELANVAPAAGQAPRIDLVDQNARNTARSELKMTWFTSTGQVIATTPPNAALAQNSNGVVRQIVIDRSARISDAELLDDVKAAVQQLVDDTAIGDTVGVIAFDGTASVIQAPTVINSAADRTTIKNAIAGIAAGNADADVDAALQAALGGLVSDALNNNVYLITGGAETSGNNPFNQVGPYQDAGVPIYVFAYPNEDSDKAVLQALAAETGGLYQTVSNDGYNNLGNALENAIQDTSPIVDVDIKEDVAFIADGAPESIEFVVDSTLGFVTVEAYFEGLPEDAILELVDPDGTATELTCEADGDGSGRDAETFCYADIEDPATGDWTLDVTPSGFDIDLYYWIGGTGKDGEFTYAADVSSVGGQVVQYPEPIVIRASIEREIILKGVNVSAQLIAPDGEVSDLELRDDGVAPDFEADDGKYAGIFDYTMDGEYFVLVNFDNNDGNAMTTIESYQLQRGVNVPEPESITEDFERSAFTQITVRGWQEDDHFEDIDSATTLPIDNTPVAGKIDFADDGDTFVLTAPSGGGNITVRVSDLGLDMDPLLYIYTLDGSIDQEAFLETEPTSDDYLTVPLSLQEGQTVYITVVHYDEAAETGFYSISAGPALPLEASRNSPAKPANESLVYLPLVSSPAQ